MRSESWKPHSHCACRTADEHRALGGSSELQWRSILLKPLQSMHSCSAVYPQTNIPHTERQKGTLLNYLNDWLKQTQRLVPNKSYLVLNYTAKTSFNDLRLLLSKSVYFFMCCYSSSTRTVCKSMSALHSVYVYRHCHTAIWAEYAKVAEANASSILK